MERISQWPSTALHRVKGTVLLVDDDRASVMTVKKQVLSCNYDLFAASSGEEAIDVLKEEQVDILLTDIHMPGMSGIELLEHALSVRPDIQCVFITAFGEMDTAIEALKLGAYNYLLKPVKTKELSLVLEHGMERIRLNQLLRDKNLELQASNRMLQREIIEHKQAFYLFFQEIIANKPIDLQHNQLSEHIEQAQQSDFVEQFSIEAAQAIKTLKSWLLQNIESVQRAALGDGTSESQTGVYFTAPAQQGEASQLIFDFAERMRRNSRVPRSGAPVDIDRTCDELREQVKRIADIALALMLRDAYPACRHAQETDPRQMALELFAEVPQN